MMIKIKERETKKKLSSPQINNYTSLELRTSLEQKLTESN